MGCDDTAMRGGCKVARGVGSRGMFFCGCIMRRCIVRSGMGRRCFMRRRGRNGLAGNACDAGQYDCLEYCSHFFPRYRDFLI